MQTYEQTFNSAQTWQLNVAGNYFTLMGTNLGVNIRFFLGGAQLSLGEIKNVLAGLEASPKIKPGNDYAFDRIEIDVQGADTVKVGIGNGDARYNRSQGNVSISNLSGAYTHAQASVTNADQVLVAASATRRHIEIQNNSTQYLRLTFDGTAASAIKGVRVAPGAAWNPPAMYAPTTAIHGCMEVADATANNVEVVTG